jgi:cyclase
MTWDRRKFLALTSMALAAGAVPRSLESAGLKSASLKSAGLKSAGLTSAGLARIQKGGAGVAVSGGAGALADEFTPLRRGVGIYQNRGGVMGWLISPDGVVVVDSQFEDTAETFAGGLSERTDRGIDVLLNTHHHGDHVGGNATLRPNAERIVAHSHASGLLQLNANFPSEGRPDETFDTEWSMTFGDETVRAKHYGRGAHTGGDATIFFEQANIVHMGDLMFNRAYPFIDGPAGASVEGWIQVLEDVVADHSGDTIFIFGHASEAFPVTGSAADLLVQRDFLEAALELVDAGVRAGQTADQIAEGPAPVGFPDHEGPANRLATLYRVAYADVTGE